MKKVSIVLLSVLLCVSLCACSSARSKGETSADVATPNSTTVTADESQDNPVIKGDESGDTVGEDPEQNSTEQDNVHINANDLV